MSKGKDLKPHIGIFGRRNNGKSSFINTLVGQDIAIISSHPGTTTDPVKKSVEIFGVGPVVVVDTAGIDDSGDLGIKRIEKTMAVIKTIDCAMLLIADNIFGEFEKQLISEFNEYDVPYVIIHNKSDLAVISEKTKKEIRKITASEIIDFSTLTSDNFDELVEKIKKTIPKTAYVKPSLFGGIIKPKEVVLLITPIDSEAPEGRMILPQVMALRDVLDNDCICITLKETELEDFMKMGIKPSLAVTDSQAFGFVSKIIPEDIPLTGFSIVFARARANFEKYISGTKKIKSLQDGDKILILESCTHHISCDDIGRNKLPKWMTDFTGKKLHFEVVPGMEKTPENIGEYALVIQCGGCVVTQKQLKNRLKSAIDNEVAVTNYGMAIAFMNGIFDRAIAPFYQTYDLTH